MDGTTWGAPVAQGAGATPTTVIAFAPVQAQVRPHHADRRGRRQRAMGDRAGSGCSPSRRDALDNAIVIVYFAIVFGIGVYFFRRAKTSRSYFLADKSVGWMAIGASLFATNISSEHFIGLAGSGASSGLAVGHFEWLAVFMCMTLAWVFVPFYLRTNVYTMPEFLERRYGPACRWYLTTVSILAYVFTKISVSLYAGALVLRATVGWDFYTSAAVMVVATGIYTIFGGLAAVIYTEFAAGDRAARRRDHADAHRAGRSRRHGRPAPGAAARLLPHDEAGRRIRRFRGPASSSARRFSASGTGAPTR